MARESTHTPPATRESLRTDLGALGLTLGDAVMVHAAVSRVGPMLGGPDTLVGALLDAISPGGTVLAYTDWDAGYEELLDDDGRVPDHWRVHVPAFDPVRSRAVRDNGVFPEFLRTWPGVRRSANPGASIAALGTDAVALTDGHVLDYGYGPGTPLARLVARGGKVAMIGAPWDTMTLLHHAEHLAEVPGKRVKRCEVPMAAPEGVRWRSYEEFDTSEPVVDGFDDDYFSEIVADFVAAGGGVEGTVGWAPTLVVDAAAMSAHAVRWIENRVHDRADVATRADGADRDDEGGRLCRW